MKNSLGKFEGRVVEAAVLKLSGTIDDRVGTLHQDEEIYFVGKATVTKVTHGWVKEIYSRLHAGKASQLVIIDADEARAVRLLEQVGLLPGNRHADTAC